MTSKQFAIIQKRKKLSDVKLGQALGVDRTLVWKWRTGKQEIERRTELAMLYIDLVDRDWPIVEK